MNEGLGTNAFLLRSFIPFSVVKCQFRQIDPIAILLVLAPFPTLPILVESCPEETILKNPQWIRFAATSSAHITEPVLVFSLGRTKRFLGAMNSKVQRSKVPFLLTCQSGLARFLPSITTAQLLKRGCIRVSLVCLNFGFDFHNP